ncbi:uncharacterized protein N7469_000589 [Penicillium citrinum]|uniref:Uncharacterized protein n=1 Tax=Penicillium citrinum TaxID=5077 RepID=A0A9W9PDZ3_PENCI|nr:uncharacterized protein N7469_000589 [Penicillium citrinum]KAJ5242262.1 hypothetical protein N7469_000589 [Penicillium citrinum]
MQVLAELESQSKELSSAIENLIAHCQRAQLYANGTVQGKPPQIIPHGAPAEVHRARESVLAIISRLQVMLAGPNDFLKQLASQTQLLACVQWLGEFQVPACIPLDGSAMIKDVSDLIGIPESQLTRVIRMVATAGFLQECQPGHVSHSSLSASFVLQPSYLDATIFLAERVAPAALGMAETTKQCSMSSKELTQQSHHIDSNISNWTVCAVPEEIRLPRLQRQWHAYLRHGTGHPCDMATDVLTCLEPFRMANATVVEVGARSTERAIALASQYPTLCFTVQLNHIGDLSAIKNGSISSDFDKARQVRPTPRVAVQQRVLGSHQIIFDAAIYIVNLPLPIPGIESPSLVTQTSAELKAHLDVLRMNRSATMVLIVPFLSEGSHESTEAVTLMRIRDLSLLQLFNDQELEISKVVNLLSGVSDSEGRLVLVNRVKSPGKHGTVALEIKYQAYTDH